MDQVTFADYEPLAVKVGKWLLEKGYASADSWGLAEPLRLANSLGILKNDPHIKRYNRFLFFINLRMRRDFLGTIWFEDGVRNAKPERWVFEIYGNTHVEEVRKLAEEMAKTFDVKIAVRLLSKEIRLERFLFDFRYL